MRRWLWIFGFAGTLFLSDPCNAQTTTCTCAGVKADVDKMATDLVILRQHVLRLSVRLGVTEAGLRALLDDYKPLEDAAWPVERRGRVQMEKILSSVEAEHGIP